MAIFRYKAYDGSGKRVTDQMDAISRNEMLRRLESHGLYPVSITRSIDWASLKPGFLKPGGKVSAEDLSFFCRQFHTLYRSGITISECMHTIALQTSGKAFGRIILQVQEKLEEGNTLSSALSQYPETFPVLLVNMIGAGETTGYLEDVLLKMAVFYEKEHRIQARIRSATLYPKFLAFLSVALVVFMLIFVMPSFVGMFESAQVPIPGITRGIMAVSGFVSRNIILILALSGCLWVLGHRLAQHERVAVFIDRMKLKTPILREIVTKGMSGRFTGVLSMLVKSGIPMVQAMEVTARVMDNRQGEQAVLGIRNRIDQGGSLPGAIDEAGLFPPMMTATVNVGVGSGALEEVLEQLAGYFENDLEKSLDRALKILEPVMIILMAAVIGFLVVTMILPMFEMVSAIS